MPTTNITRRHFLEITTAATSAAMFPLAGAFAQTNKKFTRYNIASAGGQKALASYAKGVEAMLKLPATSPQNWLRNAFIHILDCPHGNWWFYVWHRGFLGFFEETIRNLSGDSDFALPYWDWTTQPQIPDSMFDGVLTPRDMVYEPYTGDLARFTAFLKPALKDYWNALSAAQQAQLKLRGYTDFDLVWNDVTGYSPKNNFGISANMCFATTCASRYLTRQNPKLDDKTAYNVSPFVVYAGLLPTDFYNSELNLSFSSSKTTSHNAQPNGSAGFSVLEGLPHNKVHNFIGGVGSLDPGPYGYMTNFLSPVDPIFFLHHANLDRLWDVWVRKQKHLNLPWLPTGQDLDTFSKEPFLFFVNGKGQYVTQSAAQEYFGMDRFGYDYEPGFGEKVIEQANQQSRTARPRALTGVVKDNTGLIKLPPDIIQQHLAAPIGPALVTEITVQRSDTALSSTREFDVLVGAPSSVTEVPADSPYYAGTIAFFGNMMGMESTRSDATFAVPLPKSPEAFAEVLGAPKNVAPPAVKIRLIPSRPHQKAPVVKSLSVNTF